MGQMAMSTSHGGWQTARTGGAGSPIGGRLSEPPTEDGRRVRKSNSAPGEEQVVGDASGSASKGTASVVSGCCEMYCP